MNAVLDAGADADVEVLEGGTDAGLSPAALALKARYERTLKMVLTRCRDRSVADVLLRATRDAVKRGGSSATGIFRDPMLQCVLRCPAASNAVLQSAITALESQAQASRASASSLASEAAYMEATAGVARAHTDGSPANARLAEKMTSDAQAKRLAATSKQQGVFA